MCIIAFEGIDNAGKTTQCSRLLERLRKNGYRAASTLDQPSELHELIKNYFQKGGFSPFLKTILFAAELFDHWYSHLRGVEIAVFDRYIYSPLAYGLMEGVSRDWIESVIAPLPKADLVIYLDIPVELYQTRVAGRDEYHSPYTPDRLIIVRSNYLALANENGFFRIDGTKKEAEIAEIIYRRVLVSLNRSDSQ